MTEFVYFIRCGGAVKVGTTFDIPGRMRDLAVGNPHPLELIGSVEGGRDLEMALHRRLAEGRITREWFDDSDDLRSVIAEVQARGAEAVAQFFRSSVPRSAVYARPEPARPTLGAGVVGLAAPLGDRMLRLYDRLRSDDVSRAHEQSKTREEFVAAFCRIFPRSSEAQMPAYKALLSTTRRVSEQVESCLAVWPSAKEQVAAIAAATAALADLEKMTDEALGTP